MASPLELNERLLAGAGCSAVNDSNLALSGRSVLPVRKAARGAELPASWLASARGGADSPAICALVSSGHQAPLPGQRLSISDLLIIAPICTDDGLSSGGFEQPRSAHSRHPPMSPVRIWRTRSVDFNKPVIEPCPRFHALKVRVLRFG
jgi:hypothetical protein